MREIIEEMKASGTNAQPDAKSAGAKSQNSASTLPASVLPIDAGDKSARAQLAFDMFIHRLRREIGSMIAVLGGLDSLVFTAGIGENSADVRAAACDALAFAGVHLDAAKNAQLGAQGAARLGLRCRHRGRGFPRPRPRRQSPGRLGHRPCLLPPRALILSHHRSGLTPAARACVRIASKASVVIPTEERRLPRGAASPARITLSRLMLPRGYSGDEQL